MISTYETEVFCSDSQMFDIIDCKFSCRTVVLLALGSLGPCWYTPPVIVTLCRVFEYGCVTKRFGTDVQVNL
jgi:hypothetical protein